MVPTPECVTLNSQACIIYQVQGQNLKKALRKKWTEKASSIVQLHLLFSPTLVINCFAPRRQVKRTMGLREELKRRRMMEDQKTSFIRIS